MAQFILIKDQSGLEIIEHLRRKAREGVKVKIIVDGVGAYSDAPFTKRDMMKLSAEGIGIKVYHPKWPHFYKIKKRMHDKILWVDGKAIIGSSSFWDVSFNFYQLEYDVLLAGTVTSKIKKHFFQLWHSKEVKPVPPLKTWGSIISIKRINDLQWFNLSLTRGMTSAKIQYIHDPVKKKRKAGSFKKTLSLFKKAKHNITIVNAYFLPTRKLRKLLKSLQQKGIQINIYTNSPETLALEYKMLGLAFAKLDRFFKKSKINIHENKPKTRMIHNKYFIIDDQVAYVGSQNLDYLGAKHNTENGILIKDPAFINILKQNLQMIQQHSQPSYQQGKRLREKYKIRNPLKHLWRSILVLLFKNVL